MFRGSGNVVHRHENQERLSQEGRKVHRHLTQFAEILKLRRAYPEKRARRMELVTDCGWDGATRNEPPSLDFRYGKCTRCVGQDTPQAKPDSLGVVPLAVLPFAYARARAHRGSAALHELEPFGGHRFVDSSFRRRFWTSARCGRGS